MKGYELIELIKQAGEDREFAIVGAYSRRKWKQFRDIEIINVSKVGDRNKAYIVPEWDGHIDEIDKLVDDAIKEVEEDWDA